jgi:HAD superfamily hydrolase (TIGR01490 family)
VKSREKIGAFFDLDGTLLAGPSLEWRFIAFLIACDALDGGAGARWLVHLVRNAFRDPRATMGANKMHFAGLRHSLAGDWEESLTSRPIPFFAEAMERIAWHTTQGHLVFLVSGTIEPIAHAVARRIPGCVDVCASALEVRDTHWTGRLKSEHMSGDKKEQAIRRLALRYGLDLGRSYSYGNCLADLPMLRSVGNPAAVNPDAALRRIARRRGWPVCRWEEQLTSIPDPCAPKLSAGAAR